jgi:hypothetical protein
VGGVDDAYFFIDGNGSVCDSFEVAGFTGVHATEFYVYFTNHDDDIIINIIIFKLIWTFFYFIYYKYNNTDKMFVWETKPGKVFFVVNIILILLLAGLSLFSGAIFAAIIGVIPYVIYILIATFLINCLVTGDCNKTAWLIVVLNIIIPLIMISFMVMGIGASVAGSAM